MTGNPNFAAIRVVDCPADRHGTGLPMQADAICELSRERIEVIRRDPDSLALGMNVGEDPQQAVSVRGPGRERVKMQEIVPRMKRNLPPGFFHRTKAREVDLPVAGIPFQKRAHEPNRPLRERTHDLMDSCSLFGVVLVDAFEAILLRAIADVLVMRAADLLLGHKERLFRVRQTGAENRGKTGCRPTRARGIPRESPRCRIALCPA